MGSDRSRWGQSPQDLRSDDERRTRFHEFDPGIRASAEERGSGVDFCDFVICDWPDAAITITRPSLMTEPQSQPAAQPVQPQKENEFPFSVSVGEVYDGPLDLLLDLIRKQNINIYDIPI